MIQKILTLTIALFCLGLSVACGGGDGEINVDDTARDYPRLQPACCSAQVGS